ncbi:Hypothetical protein CpOVI2C_01569 [Corynebacterium pseudotuberculosis]|nr:hypothetical protein CPTA_01630 [Corynebacterium pseudotuberculosis]AIG10189.1 hypothetical protein CPTB_02133 [Corynebacterium pseudotuberculosis]AIG11909.1 hypothetical protein CPTC_01621 [Corynebacterium pseudotuberculosis]ANH23767.1 hypothetical protein CpE55_1054 [Corynebacterium pseudotuberculosis]AQL51175.1 hypothetical protein CpPA04_1075 [Corynebacterium pseudotuberculosis]
MDWIKVLKLARKSGLNRGSMSHKRDGFHSHTTNVQVKMTT